jgi:hypothetical protein
VSHPGRTRGIGSAWAWLTVRCRSYRTIPGRTRRRNYKKKNRNRWWAAGPVTRSCSPRSWPARAHNASGTVKPKPAFIELDAEHGTDPLILPRQPYEILARLLPEGRTVGTRSRIFGSHFRSLTPIEWHGPKTRNIRIYRAVRPAAQAAWPPPGRRLLPSRLGRIPQHLLATSPCRDKLVPRQPYEILAVLRKSGTLSRTAPSSALARSVSIVVAGGSSESYSRQKTGAEVECCN